MKPLQIITYKFHIVNAENINKLELVCLLPEEEEVPYVRKFLRLASFLGTINFRR